MKFGNLIFGAALLLVATTLALTITFRNEPAPHLASPSASARTPSSRTPDSRSPGSRSPDRISATGTSPRPALPRAEEMELSLDDSPSAPALSPAERQALSARAPAVRAAALAKLDKMARSFDLTEDQRRKIFPLLVKDTPGYHPAMLVTQPGGRGALVPVEVAVTNQTPDEAIHDVLDPDQQDDYVQERIDELRWWDEIAAQLEEDLDSAVATGTAPPQEAPADPTPAPDKPDPQQSDNIFDLLNQ